MTIKSVLFDLDNTVLDRDRSLELYLAWEANEYIGLSYEDCDKYIEKFIELDNNGLEPKDQVYSALIDQFNIDGHSAAELTETYRTQFGRFSCEKRHVSQALTTLRNAGYKTGIVSNGQSPFQEDKLTDLGLSDEFDTVVVSEAAGVRKPETGIFELACRNLGVAATEAVFVGDNPVADIEGANAVGMYTVFIPSRRYSACASADAVCRDMRELPGIVHLAGNN